jgi:hypothetical protein
MENLALKKLLRYRRPGRLFRPLLKALAIEINLLVEKYRVRTPSCSVQTPEGTGSGSFRPKSVSLVSTDGT